MSQLDPCNGDSILFLGILKKGLMDLPEGTLPGDQMLLSPGKCPLMQKKPLGPNIIRAVIHRIMQAQGAGVNVLAAMRQLLDRFVNL